MDSLSSFVEEEVVGAGQFGEVVVGRLGNSSEKIAMKRIFLPDSSRKVGSRVSAFRELQCHQLLIHPYIVDYYGNEMVDSDLCLFMEYLDLDLHHFLSLIRGPLPETVIREIMWMIISGLSFCHEMGIMHRDIKPSNILLSKQGFVKLADFGIARPIFRKEFSEDEGLEFAYTHQVQSRWYRAPEILYASQLYDEKIDIWSVGCIFSELLSGQVLYPGISDIHQLGLVATAFGGDLSKQWAAISDLPDFMKISFDSCEIIPLEVQVPGRTMEEYELLGSCLAVDPDRRLSAKDLLELEYFSQFRSVTPGDYGPSAQFCDMISLVLERRSTLELQKRCEVEQLHELLLHSSSDDTDDSDDDFHRSLMNAVMPDPSL